ncbi:MAG: sugar phosphate isomerase/epimerase [Candidatus Brockarchaeota archaeon]|nr:sugar phosphate isomerase/epimerase [Candidatus Brockarchaeota archaeon]
MKFSVFTVMMPEYSPEETASILGKMGFDGVEWRVEKFAERRGEKASYWGYNRSTLDLGSIFEKAPEVKSLADRNGLEVCCLATYLGVDQQREIAKVAKAASIMECPCIRVGAPRYDGTVDYNRLYAETVRNVKEVEGIAKENGVAALLEIHMGNIMPSAGLAHRIVSNFDPEHVGVIYDPGNMVYEGYEQWKMGMELLGKYLRHVHVKNSAWLKDSRGKWKAESAKLDEGIVDWEQVMSNLRAVGYRGYLSLEDFSEQDTASKLKMDLEYLRKIQARLK